MIVGKLVWQQEEVRKEDISISLMISGDFFTSVLFRGHSGSNLIDPTLQDNVVIWSGIFHFHVPHRMRVQSSFYYPQWIDTWRSRFEQKTGQHSSCPLIQETKIIKILNILTSLYHVERNTCTVHGRGIKTRKNGLILILRSEKD